MTEEFNQWWNEDLLMEDNPFVDGTPAFWAWEGWCAGVKAEREACAVIAETAISGEQDDITMEAKDRVAKAIRARGEA